MAGRVYICIDLKSFFASVECAERGLDCMKTNLVVADSSRGDKTICLAVSPSMKALGVRNRCRLFEIPKGIKYITAPPRMQKYIDYAADIYGVYLRYIAPEDIHVYSIDEVFIDATSYLPHYRLTPKQMAVRLMDAVLKHTGVRAAAGIGTNLYLAKIALDITAKHSPDFIGILDEDSYKRTLWDHHPLTDFWRVGPGTAARLAKYNIFTMRQIAQAPENLLYRLFGVDAELLIDHARGIEPCTIADIKAYRPRQNSSISHGQVLMRDYNIDEAELIVKEMADLICLNLAERNQVTDCISLGIVYARPSENGSDGANHRLPQKTGSDLEIIQAFVKLFRKIADPAKKIRKIYLGCGNLTDDGGPVQAGLFDTPEKTELAEKHKKAVKTIIEIKKKFGKNAVLRGINLEKASTMRERNMQIGGHKAGDIHN